MKLFILLFSSLLLLNLGGCAPTEVQEVPSVFFPAPPTEPKIQFLAAIKSASNLKEMTPFESFLLGPDQGELRLNKTYDVAASPGRIYTLDRTYRKILVIDLVNKELYSIDDRQSRESQFANPGGIWATPDGRLYVTDMDRREVIAFDANGKYLKTYGGKENLVKPVDVAVFEDNIYVCDIKKNQIIVFNRLSGRMTGTISQHGPRATGLFNPTHVTVDSEGNIYVTDAFHFAVKKFRPDGEMERIFGFLSDVPGSFARPKGNAVSPDGYIYAVDAASEMVQIFNQQGQLMLFFGGAGIDPGKLYLPAGIFIDNYNAEYFREFVDPRFQVQYLILVTNLLGPNQVNVYGFGKYE
jgi:DNA-binding beta-propeller fold protein YncE